MSTVHPFHSQFNKIWLTFDNKFVLQEWRGNLKGKGAILRNANCSLSLAQLCIIHVFSYFHYKLSFSFGVKTNISVSQVAKSEEKLIFNHDDCGCFPQSINIISTGDHKIIITVQYPQAYTALQFPKYFHVCCLTLERTAGIRCNWNYYFHFRHKWWEAEFSCSFLCSSWLISQGSNLVVSFFHLSILSNIMKFQVYLIVSFHWKTCSAVTKIFKWYQSLLYAVRVWMTLECVTINFEYSKNIQCGIFSYFQLIVTCKLKKMLCSFMKQ